MPSRFGQLTGQGLHGYRHIAAPFLAFIPGGDPGIKPHRKDRRLREGPRQVAIAVLGIVLTFLLLVGATLALDRPAVGGVIASAGKTLNSPLSSTTTMPESAQGPEPVGLFETRPWA